MGVNIDFGSLISNLSESYGSGKVRRDLSDERARDAQARDIEVQRARIAPDMMAKVEAAKAAGLHPLVAMGMSPVSGGSWQSAGGGGDRAPVTSAGVRTSDVRERDPSIERYNVARADLAELEVEAAERRLAGQPGNAPSVQSSYLHQGSPAPGPEGMFDLVKRNAAEQVSRSSGDSSTSAASNPFWDSHQLTDRGLMVLLPRSQEGPSEVFENTPAWFWPVIIEKNMQAFGTKWILDMLDMFPAFGKLHEGVREWNRRRNAESVLRGALSE